MRKIICALMVGLLSFGSASAETLYLTEDSDNSSFNIYLKSKGLPICLPGTYAAWMSSDDGEPWGLSQKEIFDIFVDVYAEGEVILNKIQDDNSLTIYLEMPNKWREVYKRTYIDGYDMTQNCPVKFF